MSVSQRKDGRYIVKYKAEIGWKQKSFRTLADAEAFNSQMEYDEEENKRLTVVESILLFLKGTEHCATRKKKYIRVMERMGDTIGGKYVEDLDRRDLETFRDVLRSKGICVNAINESAALLKTVWRWCASEDAIRTVPWERYRDLPGGTPRKGWNGGVEAWKKVYDASPEWMQWALRTCLALCCRPGKEICCVTWDRIDLERRTARIWMPKVGAEKTVMLPGWWVAEAEALERPAGGHVCLGFHGRPIRNGAGMTSTWTVLCRKLGIRCPMYTVRHIAASLMLEAGADAAAVAAQLGHRNVTTTGTFYLHATASAQEKAAVALPAPCDLVQDGKRKCDN